MEKAQAVIDRGIENRGSEAHWYWHARDVLRQSGDGPADPRFSELLDQQIALLDSNQVPWRERCNLMLISDLRDAGRPEDTASMMSACHERFEERIKVQYLCPCSFLGLVMYTILDGRTDEAVERAEQWLSNGDSNSWLPYNHVFAELKDRPEYAELLARNEEQLARQREIYAAGRNAAD